jgi:hypothetical protein
MKVHFIHFYTSHIALDCDVIINILSTMDYFHIYKLSIIRGLIQDRCVNFQHVPSFFQHDMDF